MTNQEHQSHNPAQHDEQGAEQAHASVAAHDADATSEAQTARQADQAAAQVNSESVSGDDVITTESVADLSKLISELQAQVADLSEQVLRAKASEENVRRRSAEEVSKARRFAVEGFAESLLPVRDSLEAALSHEDQSVENFAEGVQTTLNQLTQAFERYQLKEIAPAPGDAFDHNLHEAVSAVPGTEFAANTVIQVVRKGYTLSDRVVRAAAVIVAV